MYHRVGVSWTGLLPTRELTLSPPINRRWKRQLHIPMHLLCLSNFKQIINKKGGANKTESKEIENYPSSLLQQ